MKQFLMKLKGLVHPNAEKAPKLTTLLLAEVKKTFIVKNQRVSTQQLFPSVI